MIKPPKLARGHPHRVRECEAALERDAFEFFDRHGVQSELESMGLAEPQVPHSSDTAEGVIWRGWPLGNK